MAVKAILNIVTVRENVVSLFLKLKNGGIYFAVICML